MRPHVLLAGLASGLLAIHAVAAAPAPDDGHRHVLPARVDAFTRGPGWRIAPPSWPVGGGTRVAAFVDADAAVVVSLEARGVDGDRAGAWVPLVETWHGAGSRVAIVDLEAPWPGAELRVAEAAHARVRELRWELIAPRHPLAGAHARAVALAAATAGPPDRLFAIPDVLAPLGIVSRETWGARPQGCSSREDDWYRMAIHHTAEAQTRGGTVTEVVQGLQAYAQDSGEYCDIPYQFLVGFDGSLWEARGIDHTSGATGGGNNPGNLAVCFMGCYHPEPACPVAHPAPDVMLAAGRLLVQSLRKLEEIPSDAASIKGHRDWPGNATACPGDFVHARLDELRTELAWYAATEVARSFPADGAPALEIPIGTPVPLTVELANTGGLTWAPGVVHLGTAGPRDATSPLGGGWANPARPATVTAATPPGQVGTFAFTVTAPAAGDYELALGLVADGTSWFSDGPWGGGPADGSIVVRVRATEDATLPPGPGAPADGMASGCGCGVGRAPRASTGATALTLVAAALALGARRRYGSKR